MSLLLHIKRVEALPANVEPSSLYIVKSTEIDLTELFFTNNDGTEIRHLINRSDVLELIANNAITSVDWSIIQNGPMVSVSDIDQAVLDSHVHGNKTELDLISADSDGNLMFDNKYPRVPLVSCEW